MKIGVLGKFGPEEMGKHISDTLKEMKYEVFDFEFGPYLNQKKNNSKFYSKIIKKFIKQAKIESRRKWVIFQRVDGAVSL